MQFNNIYEHGKFREEYWLSKHVQHEYEKHDLVFETCEELADAYNYMQYSNIQNKENILNTLAEIYEMLVNNANHS